MRSSLWLIAVAGCGRIGFDTSIDSLANGDTTADTPLGAWSNPTQVPGANNTTDDEQDCTLSSNLLELYFDLSDPEDTIYLMTRTSVMASWSAPEITSFDSVPDEDANPRLSPTDLVMYFGSARTGTQGFQDVMVTQRASVGAAWDPPQFVTETGVNTADFDKWFNVCNGGFYVMVRTLLSQGLGERIMQGQLGGPTPQRVPELDIAPAGSVSSAYLSPDCLTLYFAADPSGQHDIYITHRATPFSTWDAPQVVPEFSSPIALDEDPWMSPDGRTFCFASDRANPGSGVRDLYISTR